MGFINLNKLPAPYVTGTIRSANRHTGNYQGTPTNRVQLHGDFDGHPPGSIVEAPVSFLAELTKLRIVHEQEDGVLSVDPKRVKIGKTGQGTATRWYAQFADGSAPQQDPQNGQQTPRASAGPTAQSQAAETPGATFARLSATMAACVREARKAWGVAPDAPLSDAVAATAHSLFIASDRRNCLWPVPKKAGDAPSKPPITHEQQVEIDRLTEELGPNVMALKAKLLEASGGTSLAALTQEQATLAIRWLQNEVAKALVAFPSGDANKEDEWA